MQDIDNHMDDLFRNAAENYRPSSGIDQWDYIQSEITHNNKKPFIVNKKKLFLIPNYVIPGLLLMCASLLIPYNLFMPLLQESKHSFETVGKNVGSSFKKISKGNKSITKAALFSFISRGNERIHSTLYENPPSKINNPDFINVAVDSVSKNKAGPIMSLNSSLVQSIDTGLFKSNNVLPLQKNELVYDNIDTGKVRDSLSMALPRINNNNFYFGFIAGSEFSGVKTINTMHPGYKAGVVAGYRIDKNISIETGFSFNKKNYSCNGLYFNQQKITEQMPPGMKIISLTGYCTSVEIPLRVNLSIWNKNKISVFSSVGISSIITTKESNLYKTLYNGDYTSIKGSYNQMKAFVASSVDFRIGMERRFHNGTSVRIEPYIQLPLRGTGIGEIKVRSAGFSVGYMIFK